MRKFGSQCFGECIKAILENRVAKVPGQPSSVRSEHFSLAPITKLFFHKEQSRLKGAVLPFYGKAITHNLEGTNGD